MPNSLCGSGALRYGSLQKRSPSEAQCSQSLDDRSARAAFRLHLAMFQELLFEAKNGYKKLHLHAHAHRHSHMYTCRHLCSVLSKQKTAAKSSHPLVLRSVFTWRGAKTFCLETKNWLRGLPSAQEHRSSVTSTTLTASGCNLAPRGRSYAYTCMYV